MNFAWRPCDEDEDEDGVLPEDLRSISPKWWPHQQNVHHVPTQSADQMPLDGPRRPKPGRPRCVGAGWLHTYAPSRDLQLLYIDGMSAAKSDLGTLDSQDAVLLWEKPPRNDPRHGGNDLRRALGLCDLAKNAFENKGDGFIRMEHGFEIVLCDFSVLEVVSILRAEQRQFAPSRTESADLGTFSFLRAVASRYDGIGGDRVRVSYDNFVTVFTHAGVDLWPDDGEQPRLVGVSNDTASSIVDEVKQLVLAAPLPRDEQIDWQSIADLYVTRYSRPIQYLTSPAFTSAEALRDETRRLFRPYLNHSNADRMGEIARCREAYIPPHLLDGPVTSLAQEAVLDVAHTVCTALHLGMVSDDLEGQQRNLHDLMNILRWTTWKKCQPSCALDELCFTAIWPFGTQEDHDRPSCRNATGISGRMGYWLDHDGTDPTQGR